MRRSGYAVLLTAWLAVTVLFGVPRADEPVLLREIASVRGANGLSLVIETTAPVAYVASKPDPLTVQLDLKGATSVKAAVRFVASADVPVRSVRVEDVKDPAGRVTARVRITLGRVVPYTLRSERATIRAHFDTGGPLTPAPAAAAPADGVAVLDAMDALRNVRTGYIRTTTADGESRLVPLHTAPSAAPPAPATPPPPASAPPSQRVVAPTIVLDPVTAVGAQTPPAAPPQTVSRIVSSEPPQTPPPQKPPIPLVPPPQPQPQQTPPQQPQQTPPPTAPPPQPVPDSLLTVSGQVARQFTGEPISVDFVDAAVRDVLRTLALEHNLNIVLDPGITGTVTLTLTQVPWDQVMDIVMRTAKLDWVAEGNVVRIAPLATLQAEQEARRTLAETQAQQGLLVLRTYQLSYAKADSLRTLMTNGRVVSERGSVEIDPRTNTLIVTDLPQSMPAVEALIAALDKPEPQVEIEARIVQTTSEFAKAVGIQWGFNGRVSPELGNTTPLQFPNTGTLGGRTGADNVPQDPRRGSFETTPTIVNLPVTGATTALGIALGSVNGSANLDIALSLLERTGKGRILSTPRVVAQNNTLAEMTQGIQIPIQTVANNTVSVTFRDAALKLLVTPQITASGTVIMTIDLENSTPDFSRQVNGIPPIDTQRARSTMLVADGQTGVVGGIFVSREQTSKDRTPGLHQIPLLGWLFRRDVIADESRELLIFLTPRIVQ